MAAEALFPRELRPSHDLLLKSVLESPRDNKFNTSPVGSRASSPGLLLAEAATQQRSHRRSQRRVQPVARGSALRQGPGRETPFTFEALKEKTSRWKGRLQVVEARKVNQGRMLLARYSDRSNGGCIGLHKPQTASACITMRGLISDSRGPLSLNEKQMSAIMFERAQTAIKLSRRQQVMAARPLRAPLFRWSPLHTAASNGCVGTVQALLNARADAGSGNRWDHTPMYYAQKYGHQEVVDLLRASC